jgi:regulator of sigma E protease
VDVVVRPKEHGGGYRVGISFSSTPVWRPLPIGQALARAASHPVEISREQVAGLWRLASGKGSTDEVGGPVMIVDQLKGSFDRGPWTALYALIFMNVVIGLLNLLPLPALDGGRLAFLAYNVVTRRRANVRVEMAVHTIGFLLLFGLLIMITVRDVSRIFGG